MLEDQQQALSLTPEAALEEMLSRVARLPVERRVVVGLAGGPGVGKSTLATALVEKLGPKAAYVPMDGFHRRHAELERLGTVRDKGMPHTFDGDTFVSYLSTLKSARSDVPGPGYSRAIEDVVENAFIVPSTAFILVVEGNYLLLPDAPWNAARPLLDLSIFLHVPRDKVLTRLMKRHAEHGLFTEERNREHVERVDLANYDLVSATRPRADLAIDLVTEA